MTRRGTGLGLELAPPRPAEIATCANKCVFCFIHQLPKGMRKSLYVKDDDFRLSFLHGNYITLTDLDETELARIETQRLSPLYVSVHATDPDLRHALLGQPRVRRELLPVMERLAKAGIAMHAQIVLCPGWNDGAHLERTVHELARLHPAVPTTAVVPVGLTRHRERLPDLRRSPPTRRSRSCATSRAGSAGSRPRSAPASCGPRTSCTWARACRCRPRAPTRGSRSRRTASASSGASRTPGRARWPGHPRPRRGRAGRRW